MNEKPSAPIEEPHKTRGSLNLEIYCRCRDTCVKATVLDKLRDDWRGRWFRQRNRPFGNGLTELEEPDGPSAQCGARTFDRQIFLAPAATRVTQRELPTTS